MIDISNEISINENQITQLLKVEEKYYIILASGERVQISETQYQDLGGE